MKKRLYPIIFTILFSSILFLYYLANNRVFTNKFTELTTGQAFSSRTILLSLSEQFSICSTYIVVFLFLIILFVQALYFISCAKLDDLLELTRQKYIAALEQNDCQVWEYDVSSDTLRFFGSSFSPVRQPEIFHPFRKFLSNNNLIYPDDQDILLRLFDTISSKEMTVTAELRIKESAGQFQWYTITGHKLLNSKGRPVCIIGRIENIEQQKQALLLHRQKACEDSLTGLPNRAALAESIDHIIAKFDHPSICALYLIDLDDLSQINDKYGYLFGNGIIMDAAAKLKKLVQEEGLLSRSGGDEFLVFFTDLPSVDSIHTTAELMLSEFHNISSSGSDAPHVSASIGIALFPKDGTSFLELYEAALTALSTAKASGRNCYRFYTPESIEPKHKRAVDLEAETAPCYEDSSMIDRTLLTNAINILSDSRDLNTTIDLLLSMTGSYFELDRLNIFEYSEDGTLITCTHEWTSKAIYRISSKIQNLSKQNRDSFSLFQTCPSGIFYIDEILEFKEKNNPYLNFLDDNYTRALYECGLSGPDGFIGYVAAASCEKPFRWKKNIVDTLTMLSRLIGGYIINFRILKKTLIQTEKDSLIDAYNFNTFLDRANERLSVLSNTRYAMIYTDIHQFKLINDNYGYPEGDRILIRLADIFHEIGGKDSLLCRVTGDRFVALFSYQDTKVLEDKIKILLIKSRHMEASNHTFYRITLKIGVYQISSGDSAIVAVDRANIARKNAQISHETNYVYFTSQMRSSLIKRKEIEDIMDGALFRHEFEVYYQPKIDLVTGAVAGAEALVRWNRPEQGLIPPDQFIPLFEENGFIVPLDYYVLERVCQQLRSRLDAGKPIVPVSVNFSRSHFSKDVLARVLIETANAYHISPSFIEVEITESILAENDSFLLAILQKIQSYGFSISMDDFGSGLSSLNMLSAMPFNTLKIDKDFFHTKTTSERERIVISNIVRMAHELNMEVICEGVETEEQAGFLRGIQCNVAQGFLFSKPVPFQDFTRCFLDILPADSSFKDKLFAV